MTSVSRKEWFQYGFYVFAYWLVLLAFSGVLVAAGGWIVSEQPLDAVGANQEGVLVVLGAFVAFLGVLVFGSGQVGLAYKVVADGVRVGSGAGNAGPSGSVRDPEEARVGTGAPTEQGAGQPAAGPDAKPAGAAELPAEPGMGGESAEPSTEATGEPTPRPRERPSGEAATGPAADADEEPTEDTGSGEATDTQRGVGDRPEETGSVQDDAGEPATGDDDPLGPATDDSRSGQPTRNEPTVVTGAEPTADPGDEASAGDPDAGEPSSEEGESPADVVSDSEIADELGFASGDDEPEDGVTDAETVIEAEDADAGGERGAGSEAGRNGPTSGDTADQPGARNADDADSGGTGSLADALAGADDAEEDETEDDAAGADTEETPTWTMGEDHMGGPGEDDAK